MKVSILIVDDTDMDRYLLKRYLKKTSFEVVVSEATDGENAIAFFEDYGAKRALDPDRYPPLLIFLDINMPKVSGFQFLEAFESIRVKQNLSSTVVVMFTSSPREEDKADAFSWGFVQDYVVKGEFSHAQLDTVIATSVLQMEAALEGAEITESDEIDEPSERLTGT